MAVVALVTSEVQGKSCVTSSFVIKKNVALHQRTSSAQLAHSILVCDCSQRIIVVGCTNIDPGAPGWMMAALDLPRELGRSSQSCTEKVVKAPWLQCRDGADENKYGTTTILERANQEARPLAAAADSTHSSAAALRLISRFLLLC